MTTNYDDQVVVLDRFGNLTWAYRRYVRRGTRIVFDPKVSPPEEVEKPT